MTKEVTEKDNFLFNKFFRNKIFDLYQQMQDVRDLYIQLVTPEGINLLDRYALVYTQIELVMRDLKTLQSIVDQRIWKDFEIAKAEPKPFDEKDIDKFANLDSFDDHEPE